MHTTMITLIIKSYFAILLSVGIGSLCLFILGLYFIFRKTKSNTLPHPNEGQSVNDLSAIAGDDVIATQLDLARAYIETDKKSLATAILNSVVVQGNMAQQNEARRLLSSI